MDYDALKRDYCAGLSLRVLAVKYGVPRSTIADWVKKGQWIRDPSSAVGSASSGHPMEIVRTADNAVTREDTGPGQNTSLGQTKIGQKRNRYAEAGMTHPRMRLANGTRWRRRTVVIPARCACRKR